MTGKTVKINSQNPETEIIRQAAEKIRSGGVVIFPTWCLYGIGVDAFNEDAVSEIFRIKKRRPENPLLILIRERADLERYVAEIPDEAVRIMDRFWPGRVTLIFRAKPDVPGILTAGTGKIGIRIPEHPVARSLISMLDNPITGTSANFSGEPGCSAVSEMDAALTDQCDMTLDSGRLKGGRGSTIVDVTVSPLIIIREGETPGNEIMNIQA